MSGRENAEFRAGAKPQGWPSWKRNDWWERLATAPRSLLMLDYDGTLAPFVKDRLQAALYPGVAERLVRLADCPHSRLVFVSGRQAEELDGLLPGSVRAEIWGSHGREHLLPDGTYDAASLTPPQAEALLLLDRSVRERGFAGSIESKAGTTALHTRELPPEEQQRLTEVAKSVFAEIKNAGFNWLPFDGGIEVRAIGRSKATAVEEILKGEDAAVPAAYLGDDLTDEEAFHALAGRALRVLVREEARSTVADLWLRPPDELLAFLDRWLEAACAAGSSARPQEIRS